MAPSGHCSADLRAILKPARSAVAREATLVSAITARTVCTSPSRLAIDGKIFKAVDAAPGLFSTSSPKNEQIKTAKPANALSLQLNGSQSNSCAFLKSDTQAQ